MADCPKSKVDFMLSETVPLTFSNIRVPTFKLFIINSLLSRTEPSANLYLELPMKSDSFKDPVLKRVRTTSGERNTEEAPESKTRLILRTSFIITGISNVPLVPLTKGIIKLLFVFIDSVARLVGLFSVSDLALTEHNFYR